MMVLETTMKPSLRSRSWRQKPQQKYSSHPSLRKFSCCFALGSTTAIALGLLLFTTASPLPPSSIEIDPAGSLTQTEDRLEQEEESNSSMILAAPRVVSLGLPFLVYGTAWKKERTADLVAQAIRSGFRFIDTACQPKHYNEPLVGVGWTTAATELGLARSDLYLQTKYTSVNGQDPNNIPYDPSLPKPEQVATSLRISLQNLKTDYLDAWLLHGLERDVETTMQVYRAMEQAVDAETVKRIGVSNCYDIQTFRTIYEMARIKPTILQNRFYGDAGWDQELRAFCKEHGIWYQSFWTLTANRQAIHGTEAREWAARKGLPSSETLLYAYLLSLGYGTPLDGTTSTEHMQEDIAVMNRVQQEFMGKNTEEKIFETDEDLKRFEKLLGF